MFETERIQAVIHKVQYDGKKEAAEVTEAERGETGVVEKKNALVSVTLKTLLEGEFLAEVEQKYFPGASALASLTLDKSKHFKNSLKMKSPEQTLSIINEDSGKSVLDVVGVELNPPMNLVCKEGEAWLFVRVQFQWAKSLNILKALDQCSVEYTLFRTQAEFDLVFEEASNFDSEGHDDGVEEEPEHSNKKFSKFKMIEGVQKYIEDHIVFENGKTFNDALEYILLELVKSGVYNTFEDALDHKITPSDVDKILFDDNSPFMEIREESSNGTSFEITGEFEIGTAGSQSTNTAIVPEIPGTASERPVFRSQVDYRLCSVPSQKIKTELSQLGEAQEYAVGQHAALLAFDRDPDKGKKVKITVADFKQAKEAVLKEAVLVESQQF